jgi:hypothetical protein
MFRICVACCCCAVEVVHVSVSHGPNSKITLLRVIAKLLSLSSVYETLN